MPGAPGLRALWLCAALCASPCAPQPGPRPACPAPCRCHEDGSTLSADCSERGLSAVPPDLDPLTAYLDLSMNNLTELRPGLFLNLRFLEELRLSGNCLSHIPGQAFSGLYSLKILMLQNNLLGGIPAEALWELRSLQSLRLDADLVSLVPDRSFEGLSPLRHLWLDDSVLTEIPIRALGSLRALQAVTLALNRIGHIPDYAFRNLSGLVVPHLHNNHVQHLGTHSFEGLHNLETLDLNYNQLHEFPVAVRTLGRLQELLSRSGPSPPQDPAAPVLLGSCRVQARVVPRGGVTAGGNPGRSLNGATDIQGFPDLKGTTSLESLTLTRAGLRRLPPGMCQQLPGLRVLELSHNRIEALPGLHGCQKLEEIGLQHNRIWEIRADTFRQLTSLQALDLSRNAIRSVHPEAFATLRSLVKLDLTDNQLTTLPLAGLGGLVHLKLQGNWALSQAFPKDSFPKLRTLEVPYAYQCCPYSVCPGFFKALGRRAPQGPHPEDRDAPKRPLGLLGGPAESRYDVDPDELQLEMGGPRPHPTVQCSPVPGPFKPCEHLFESWGVRLAVWAVVLLSVLCNGLVLLSPSAAGPGPLPPVKFVVGAIAGASTLTGLSRGLLALVDALTFGRFAEYGARWESGSGCQAAGFLAVLGSEASVRARGKAPAPGSLRAGALGCLVLAGPAAALPPASVGEYGAPPLCLPYAPPDGRPAALGFAAALVVLNTSCLLAVAAAPVRLSCDPPGPELEAAWDGAAVRRVACLTFADGPLFCPVASLSLASALGPLPVSPEAVEPVLPLVPPLSACLDALLCLLFSPHFRADLRRLRPCPGVPGPLALAAAGQLEPSSCDSTQALVAFSDVGLVLEAPEAGPPPGLEACGLTSVTLAPCQQPGGSRPEGSHFAEPEGTRFGNRPPAVDGGQPPGAEGAVPAAGGRAGASRL
ncbi:leucine-rich repeat-containing G-protein coupled receptor 6 [Physeter macrocephalus]|uniref:Leucine-rich repeat-containing G-protein coupled receptor 6 n=1 Tax=Physeter macrocephalus TaxID=9755 RepID=A0A2Y9TE16_PHYMC|nr:leucine-rich repeat-containing G-protein coupled receptor 6 [Physeter catodon]|eukprot:XP_023986344.1 leucine-rich repeat-containing G-protein coupled receptor 6 [Physeter catodon]